MITTIIEIVEAEEETTATIMADAEEVAEEMTVDVAEAQAQIHFISL